MSIPEPTDAANGVAIIGMSGRFPGARDLEQFWQNLRDGVESISFFSAADLESDGMDPTVLQNPDYVNAGGVLRDIELFDASFFGISARDAEIMDPQQRLFLECAWQSLEHAGYNPEAYQGLIGVYAGAAMSTYLFNLYSNSERLGFVDHFQILLGNDKDYLATLVSYKLNLRGPSVTVQTACSTSLVAVCMACESLLAYRCDMALAGGVSVSVPSMKGYFYQREGISSPDGHCRSFDAAAQGTVPGNGLGIVVLKRLADAIADGDTIHAVIKGTAVNNDGSMKVGFTAPSIEGQAEVIAMAQADAGVDPATISCVEAHGTATVLGDPIEVAALSQVFREKSLRNTFCALGSVKSNIGHLDPAAGVAGLIKTVLALEHQQIPPSLHFKRPNPQIDFENSPFYVNTMLREWDRGQTPRRAGVSSFGIGGTNAHVVLEEAPPRVNVPSARPRHLLVLSARTSSALENATDNLAGFFKRQPELNVADLAYSTQVGRKAFPQRRFVVCRSVAEAVQGLEARDPQRTGNASLNLKDRPVVFMFSPQGTQQVNMMRELYEVEPAFREDVDRCCNLLRPELPCDLREVLYPAPGAEAWALQQLDHTAITQPALFVVEYALARLWMSWGISPQAMIGHSIGEFVAACLAGVFSAEEALRLVAARGRLMGERPEGAMTAVPLSERELRPLLQDELGLAAVNGPNLCVISGPTAAVNRMEARLVQERVRFQRLRTSHAFHSTTMEQAARLFIDEVRATRLQPPQIPYISNVTGNWVTAEEAVSPDYWGTHLRQTVRFSDGLEELLKLRECTFLEVGPGQTLSALARQHPAKGSNHVVLSSLGSSEDRQAKEIESLFTTLGQLWLSGVPVNWAGFNSREQRRRVPLPGYPFERERYWIERQQQSAAAADLGSLTKRTDIADWFYVPSWRLMPRPLSPLEDLTMSRLRWLVFVDECGLGRLTVQRLLENGQQVTTVGVGGRFASQGNQHYEIDPRQPDDYATLVGQLSQDGQCPDLVLHFWSVTPPGSPDVEPETIEPLQDLGFYSLLFLAQALSRNSVDTPLNLAVVSNQVQVVTGEESLHPAKATLLGPCKVIPQEYSNIKCRSIDVDLPRANEREMGRLVEQILGEVLGEDSDVVVAYRKNWRCVQSFEPVRLSDSLHSTGGLRKGGVYLVTGGLGGIGLALAEHMARAATVRLVLTSRTSLPEREGWEQWLVTHDGQDEQSLKIRRLREIEQLGAEVLVVKADAADRQQMQDAIRLATERFGPIQGVVHCAGVAGGGLIQLKTREAAASVLAPKVSGTLVLNSLLKDQPLDFFFVCSSLASMIGGFGQVDYCAANAFLDAFAHFSTHRTDRVGAISVNWDTWQEVGMAVNTQVPPELEPWRAQALSKGMLSREGAEVFARVLSADLPQVAVATKDLRALMAIQPGFFKREPVPELEDAGSVRPQHVRPVLTTEFVAPRNETEQSIVRLWQELLGVESVGVHDNFFELGGHSLLAIHLNARLADAFRVELSVRKLFDAPTPAELAKVIEDAMAERYGQVEKIGELLERIEQLSDEEVRSMLADRAEAQTGN